MIAVLRDVLGSALLFTREIVISGLLSLILGMSPLNEDDDDQVDFTLVLCIKRENVNVRLYHERHIFNFLRWISAPTVVNETSWMRLFTAKQHENGYLIRMKNTTDEQTVHLSMNDITKISFLYPTIKQYKDIHRYRNFQFWMTVKDYGYKLLDEPEESLNYADIDGNEYEYETKVEILCKIDVFYAIICAREEAKINTAAVCPWKK